MTLGVDKRDSFCLEIKRKAAGKQQVSQIETVFIKGLEEGTAGGTGKDGWEYPNNPAINDEGIRYLIKNPSEPMDYFCTFENS